MVSKKVTKLFAGLLVVVMACGLVGCGFTKKPDVGGTIKNEQKEEEKTDINDSKTEIEETEKKDEKDVVEKEETVDLSMGKAEGNVYESEFLGVGFKLPEGWTFYTAEQIKELNGLTTDMLDEDIAETIKNASIVYDMMALDNAGNSTNVNIEKVNAAQAAIITEEKYAEIAIPSLKNALSSMGFSSVTAEASTTKFAGEDAVCIDIVCSNGTVTMYEKVVCKKIGTYMAAITVASAQTDTTENILGQFYKLEK